MATINWIKSDLERAGASYEELHHRTAISAQQLAHAEHVSGKRVAKVVVVLAGGSPVMLALPADRRVHWPSLHTVLGTDRVRLATETEMAGWFGDSALGAEPPLRHWKGVELWMDESLRTSGDIVFPAGTHEDGIRMRFEDWLRLAEPWMASFTV